MAVVLALVACALGVAHLASGERPAPALRESSAQAAPAAAAVLAYAAMRRRFAFADGRYAASSTRHTYAQLWPLSQAVSASLAFGSLPVHGAAAARSDALRTLGALAHYRFGNGYKSSPLPLRRRGGNLYYDDNNWIALDLLAVYRLTGSQPLLRRAEGVFQFLVSGWDTNAGDVCTGGVYWARPPLPQIRTTVSTANAALVALRLFQATGRRSYLVWAQRMYGWVTRCLAGPNGLYYDHLDSLGNVSKQEWTYNQGAMIAAAVLLAGATKQQAYLEQAQASAKAALAHYGASGYKGEPPIFVAIFFSDLSLLQHVVRFPLYRAALRHYLQRHVALHSNGHFGSGLLFQTAAVQLYSLAAAPG